MAKDTPNKPGDEKEAAQQTAPGGPAEQPEKPDSEKNSEAPVKGDTPDKGGKEPDAPASTTVIDFGKAQQEAQKTAKPAARRGRPPKQEQEAPATSGQDGPKSPGPAAPTDKVAEARALLAELDGKQEWEMTSTDMEQKKQAEKTVAQAERAAKRGKGKPAADKDTPPAGKEKAPPTFEKIPPTAKEKAAIEKELREKFGIPKSDKPGEAWTAPETETVEKLAHNQLRPFNNHPFNVDTSDPKFQALTVSIRTHGISQPIVARPIPGAKDGQLEIVSGHRRQAAALAAGLDKVPVIVRALNNEQAIQQMVEDNVNNREIGSMELARALKMQLDSIKRQGARSEIDRVKDGNWTDVETVGKRSNATVAERNGMSVKQVQRYIALNNLIPQMQEYLDSGKAVDAGAGKSKAIKIGFVPAVELSSLSPQNQEYLAVAIEAQQATPSHAQCKRMRELEKKGILNGDMIDSIMTEEKKEVSQVIISGAELETYFGKDKTPTQMKEKILELLDKEFKPQERDAAKTEKKAEQPEK